MRDEGLEAAVVKNGPRRCGLKQRRQAVIGADGGDERDVVGNARIGGRDQRQRSAGGHAHEGDALGIDLRLPRQELEAGHEGVRITIDESVGRIAELLRREDNESSAGKGLRQRHQDRMPSSGDFDAIDQNECGAGAAPGRRIEIGGDDVAGAARIGDATSIGRGGRGLIVAGHQRRQRRADVNRQPQFGAQPNRQADQGQREAKRNEPAQGKYRPRRHAAQRQGRRP